MWAHCIIATLPETKSDSYRFLLYLIQFDPETIFLLQDEEEGEHSTEHHNAFQCHRDDSYYHERRDATIQCSVDFVLLQDRKDSYSLS